MPLLTLLRIRIRLPNMMRIWIRNSAYRTNSMITNRHTTAFKRKYLRKKDKKLQFSCNLYKAEVFLYYWVPIFRRSCHNGTLICQLVQIGSVRYRTLINPNHLEPLSLPKVIQPMFASCDTGYVQNFTFSNIKKLRKCDGCSVRQLCTETLKHYRT
jgi:hypothetical protein